jgi:hypothetical protein
MKSKAQFFQKIPDLFRKFFLKRVIKKIKKIINGIESDLMDKFLETLLGVIRLVIFLDHKFARNVRNFNARYAFRSESGKIEASAVFTKNKLIVKKSVIPDTNVTVIFKDGKALWEFLMAANPDVFSFVLENKLRYEGNLNYLMKFAYMAKHMKLMFGL